MGDVDVPGERPLDLGAALAQHLLGVGVLPQVVDVAREAGLAASSDGAWVIGPKRYASYSQLRVRCTPMSSVGLVAQRGVAGPRRRHHDRRAGGDAVAERARTRPRWRRGSAPRSSHEMITSLLPVG